jgi:hypothetical protein
VAFVVTKQVTIEDDVVTLVLAGMPSMIVDCHSSVKVEFFEVVA